MRSVTPTVLLLAALARHMIVNAQQPAGTSAGEQALRELVRAMNGGDRTALRRLVDEQFARDGPNAVPTEQRVERLIGIHARFGGFAIKSVDASKPREVGALVQALRTET